MSNFEYSKHLLYILCLSVHGAIHRYKEKVQLMGPFFNESERYIPSKQNDRRSQKLNVFILT